MGVDLLARALIYATMFKNIVLGDHARIDLIPREIDKQGVSDQLVSKSVVSSKMRLIFFAGLEGAGHHYLVSSFNVLFKKHPELERLGECDLTSAYYLTESMTKNPSTYAEAHERAKTQMRALALQGQRVSSPGTVGFLTDEKCHIRMWSYPGSGGESKVQQYVDVRMLAEIAEAEGVDLRIVYLKRSAKAMIIADTQHRHFQSDLGGPKKAPETERFMKYMRILFTDMAAMHSGLSEIDPGFVVCHDFAELGDTDQAAKIADFVAPSTEVANMTFNALLATVHPHEENVENVPRDDADVLIKRLQEKLSVLERSFC